MTSPSLVSKTAWITLVILGLTVLITMYVETMLLPAIPDIIKEFGISYDTSSWILSSYLIAGAVSVPIMGRLSDLYGRKKMVVAIMVIYMAGISLGGFSSNITFLIIARVIQGIGISMIPIAFGIIRDQLPEQKLAIGVGIFSSMFAAGSVVGLALGANIIEHFGWRATFFSIVFVALGLWLVIRRIIHDDQDPQGGMQSPKTNPVIGNNSNHIRIEKTIEVNGRIKKDKKGVDVKGTVTLALTVTSFLFVLSYSQTAGNTNFLIVPTFLSVGAVSLVLFILIERRSKSPLVNLQLLTNKGILAPDIILVIAFLSMFAIFQTIPVLVRSPVPLGFGGSAVTSAGIQLPFMIVFLLFAPSSGFIISKLGNVKPTIIGSLISATGFFSLLIFHSSEFSVASNLGIIAAGLSLMQVGAYNIVLQSTPRQFSGISLGMTVLFNLIGGSIGPAIAGIYMQTHRIILKGVNGLFPSSDSYNLIFLTVALISIVPIALAFFISRKKIPAYSNQDLSIETDTHGDKEK